MSGCAAAVFTHCQARDTSRDIQYRHTSEKKHSRHQSYTFLYRSTVLQTSNILLSNEMRLVRWFLRGFSTAKRSFFDYTDENFLQVTINRLACDLANLNSLIGSICVESVWKRWRFYFWVKFVFHKWFPQEEKHIQFFFTKIVDNENLFYLSDRRFLVAVKKTP